MDEAQEEKPVLRKFKVQPGEQIVEAEYFYSSNDRLEFFRGGKISTSYAIGSWTSVTEVFE